MKGKILAEQEDERRTEKIRVLVTPSFRHKIDGFLGDMPMSTWFMRLAEKAIEETAEQNGILAAAQQLKGPQQRPKETVIAR